MTIETTYITIQQYLNNNYDKAQQLVITDNLKDNWESVEPNTQRPMTVAEYAQACELYNSFTFSYDWNNKTLEQVYNDLRHRADCSIRNYENTACDHYLDVEVSPSSEVFKDVEYVLITFGSSSDTDTVHLSDDMNIAIPHLDYEYECCNRNKNCIVVQE